MEFLSLRPLLWLLVIVILALGLRHSLVERPRWAKWLSFALRVIGIVLLILALCRPYVTSEHNDLHVAFLVDVSESVDLEAARRTVDRVEEYVQRLEKTDSWSLHAVGNGVREFTPQDLRETLEKWQDGVADDPFRSGSRLGNALLAARMSFPAGKARRAVLFSDGQETSPQAAEAEKALRILRNEDVEVFLERVDGLAHAEAAVVSLAPSTPTAFQGEIVRLVTRLSANKALGGKLRILHRGVVVTETPVELDAGTEKDVAIDVEMSVSGASVWKAELVPDEDHFPLNNQASATITVRGEPRLLVLHEKPRDMRPFARALRGQGFSVDVRGTFGLPDSMEQLLQFDGVILANLAATHLSPRQMQLLKRYVADFGGGLAMFGSENSFGLGGYYKTPVEEVLPLVSRFEKEKEKPALAMMLVIDKSGSMSGTKIALARQASKAAVELLSPQDQIGVVAFNGNAYVISEILSAAEGDVVQGAIDSLDAGGGTNMYPAMVLGKEMLENVSAKIRHMIVLGDGQTQAADHNSLTQAMADAGITVSTVALGQGADRQLMAGIAEIGRGRYYETMDPNTVPQIFTKETMQASRSAIKEDLFGVVQVGDHPLLSGYAGKELPFTLGFVMTEAKPTAQLLLVTETGDPLLAVSRFGLGTGLAYTSDLTEAWGGEWLAWDGCGRFWAQALRSILGRRNARGLATDGEVTPDTWKIAVTRTDETGSPVSSITWDTQVLDTQGGIRKIEVKEVGLGRYEAEIPLEDHETLTARLHDAEHDKLRTLHYHRPYPPEYRLSRQLPAPLEDLKPLALEAIKENVPPIARREAVAHYSYLAGIVLVILGLLFRRV